MRLWKFNARAKRFLAIARKARLSCPKGRALYLENRVQNNGVGRLTWAPTELDILRGIKPSTATRWCEHWKAGGSIRVLSRTIAEQSAFHKEQQNAGLARQGKGNDDATVPSS
jgi:hypothetical protein